MPYLIPRGLPFQSAVSDGMRVDKTRSMPVVVSPPVEDVMENDRAAYRASSAVSPIHSNSETHDYSEVEHYYYVP